jgi:hypothetical protein
LTAEPSYSDGSWSLVDVGTGHPELTERDRDCQADTASASS